MKTIGMDLKDDANDSRTVDVDIYALLTLLHNEGRRVNTVIEHVSVEHVSV